MRVIVVGAGIMGALVARALARRWVAVTVLDRAGAPARGVSGASFGRLNAINAAPGSADQAARVEGVSLWGEERMTAVRRCGSLSWDEDPARTATLFEAHVAAGLDLRLLRPGEALSVEPALVEPPEVAIHAPVDLAVDVASVARACWAEAASLGAEPRLGVEAERLLVRAGRVVGVQADDGPIRADAVVLATGAGTGLLLGDLAPDAAFPTSPAALCGVALDRPIGLVRGILSAPGLKVRQEGPRTLRVATGWGDGRTRACALEALRAALGRHLPRASVATIEAERHERPMPPGPVALPEGVSLAVTHPGVIRAPATANELADELALEEARA